MKRVLITVVVFVLVEAAAVLGYTLSGAYDVSATVEDNPAVAWLLETTRDRSVETHSAGMKEPADFGNAQMVRAGANHYREDCQTCHGAPGTYPGPTGKGLNPEPPKLFGFDPDQPSPAEDYWIIMHGIKMTGMPSWKHKYKPEDGWALAAFLQEFPHVTKEQYQEMTTPERK